MVNSTLPFCFLFIFLIQIKKLGLEKSTKIFRIGCFLKTNEQKLYWTRCYFAVNDNMKTYKNNNSKQTKQNKTKNLSTVFKILGASISMAHNVHWLYIIVFKQKWQWNLKCIQLCLETKLCQCVRKHQVRGFHVIIGSTLILICYCRKVKE